MPEPWSHQVEVLKAGFGTFTVRRLRVAFQPLRCTGGTTWCLGTIPTRAPYVALVEAQPDGRTRCTGKWCSECSKVLR